VDAALLTITLIGSVNAYSIGTLGSSQPHLHAIGASSGRKKRFDSRLTAHSLIALTIKNHYVLSNLESNQDLQNQNLT